MYSTCDFAKRFPVRTISWPDEFHYSWNTVQIHPPCPLAVRLKPRFYDLYQDVNDYLAVSENGYLSTVFNRGITEQGTIPVGFHDATGYPASFSAGKPH